MLDYDWCPKCGRDPQSYDERCSNCGGELIEVGIIDQIRRQHERHLRDERRARIDERYPAFGKAIAKMKEDWSAKVRAGVIGDALFKMAIETAEDCHAELCRAHAQDVEPCGKGDG